MMRSSTGQGMAARTAVDATRRGQFPMGQTETSQGEPPGAGSYYSAALVERPNLSSTRNQGPVRGHSVTGESTLPIAMTSSRNTGRVSG